MKAKSVGDVVEVRDEYVAAVRVKSPFDAGEFGVLRSPTSPVNGALPETKVIPARLLPTYAGFPEGTTPAVPIRGVTVAAPLAATETVEIVADCAQARVPPRATRADNRIGLNFMDIFFLWAWLKNLDSVLANRVELTPAERAGAEWVALITPRK
jgi:hypothetical protein